jgi:hypothetical protein
MSYSVSGSRSVVVERIVLVCCLWAFLPFGMHAQVSTASINGTVKDTAGAVIPDAALLLRNVDTGVDRRVVTNQVGVYAYFDVPTGNYTLEAAKSGFVTQKLNSFALLVNQTTTFDFTLNVGQVEQTINVEATAVHVEGSTAELGAVVSEKLVTDLPLNGRNFTQLLSLTPGVSPINVSQSSGGFGATVTQGAAYTFPAINGQNNKSNIYLLDGVNDLAVFTNTYALPPILDTIQEFKVQSHNDQAEFGSTLGGIVNVVSKSGTNAFHGTLWEFLRNSALDARNTFQLEKTPFRQNQFGGTLGGPVLLPKYNGRNRTFFYVGAQGFTFRQQSSTLYRVPTAAELQGDFSADPFQIYNPLSTRPDASNPGQFIRDPFPNNQIPAGLLNAGMLLFAKTTLPSPVFTGVPNTNAIDDTPFAQNQREWTTKFDQYLGTKDTVWFRYSRLGQDTNSSGGRQDLGQVDAQIAYNWGGNYVHIFSPTTVLDVEYGHSLLQADTYDRFSSLPQNFASQLGFNSAFVQNREGETLIPALNVPTYFSGGEQDLLHVFSNVQQVKANVTKILGSHTLKWGGELATNNGYRAHSTTNSVTFNTPQTGNPENPGGTGNSLASFLLGLPDSAQYFDSVESLRWGGVLSFYVQDQWKVSQKLTINLGLRYDRTFKPPYGRPGDHNEATGDYNLQEGVYVIGAMPALCSQAGAAPCIPGTGLPQHVQYNGGQMLFDDKKNFGPRAGLAYRLRQNTVVRASFGIFYDNWAGVTQNTQGLTGNWPTSLVNTASNLNNNLSVNPLPSTTAQNPFPTLGALPPPTPFDQQNWFIDPHEKQPYSMQWNFGVQEQLNQSTVLTVNYVGSGSRRLVLGGIYNTALTPGPGDPSLRYPFPYITPTYYDRTWGRSNYNALQVLLDKKLSNGLAYLVSYTWSKAIDIGDSGWYGLEGFSVQNPYAFNNDRGVAGFDVPQLLSVSLSYELPVGPGKRFNPTNRFLSHIVGNWQPNFIASFYSGVPYNLSVDGDIANTGNSGYERPNYLGGNANLANPTPLQWFNTSVFAVPAPFTYGNAGRFILRSDGTANVDLSIFRIFPIRESKSLEFRAEMFNAFNTPVYAAPNGDISTSTFGQVTSTANQARQIQLALKLRF